MQLSTRTKLSTAAVLAAGAMIAAQQLNSRATAKETQAESTANADGEQKMPMKCPMMTALKGLEFHADNPALLVSSAGQMKLTDGQLSRLQKLIEDSRAAAREVLTDDQRQQLDEAPEGPMSIMQLSMHRMKHHQTDGTDGQMCPMCREMMMKMKNKQVDSSGAE